MALSSLEILELWKKPSSYKFNQEELKSIKEHIRKNSYKAKYAIYKPVSSKDIYIGFFIDSEPYSVRKSGIENNWNFICERDITNIEYQELIANFGTNKRRFIVYQYKYIEQLIMDDNKYNIRTPEIFVEKCICLGYTGDVQLSMNFGDNQ